jgi:hypothetical protein
VELYLYSPRICLRDVDSYLLLPFRLNELNSEHPGVNGGAGGGGKREIKSHRMRGCGFSSLDSEYGRSERPFVNHSNDIHVTSINTIISLPNKNSVNLIMYIL